jgi:hypothetical protein
MGLDGYEPPAAAAPQVNGLCSAIAPPLLQRRFSSANTAATTACLPPAAAPLAFGLDRLGTVHCPALRVLSPRYPRLADVMLPTLPPPVPPCLLHCLHGRMGQRCFSAPVTLTPRAAHLLPAPHAQLDPILTAGRTVGSPQ